VTELTESANLGRGVVLTAACAHQGSSATDYYITTSTTTTTPVYVEHFRVLKDGAWWDLILPVLPLQIPLIQLSAPIQEIELLRLYSA
jgi:hypothetical protein